MGEDAPKQAARRHRTPVVWTVLALLLALAGVVSAHVTSSHPSPPQAPPGQVRLEPGYDARDASSLVPSYAIQDGGARLAMSVAGVPGATVRVDSFLLVRNDADAPREVLLLAQAAPPAHVSRHELQACGATLRLAEAAPPARLLLPAGATCEVALLLALQEDAAAAPPFASAIEMRWS